MSIESLIEELNSLTVLEAIQLARTLEKRWGVTSAVKITIFNPAVDEPVLKEKYSFDVVLDACGPRKIEVIKVLRMLIPELGLKEAKDIAEHPGSFLFQDVGKEFAYQAKEQLEVAGASVSVL